jgi:hypothetical protein
MLLSGSTSKIGRVYLWPKFGLALILLWILLSLGGCSSETPKTQLRPTVHGYVDLDRLVKLNPGWRTVALFDTTLARLQRADASVKSASAGDASLLELPAVQVEAPRAPGIETSTERIRLTGVAVKQIQNLIQHRAEARDRQIQREQRSWQDQADQQYQLSLTKIEGDYVTQYNKIYSEEEHTRLDLQLQINALKTIVQNWSLSVPPAPGLQGKKAELAIKQKALQKLNFDRSERVVEAQIARTRSIHNALAASHTFVAEQRALAEATLRTQDDQQVAAEKKNLEVQRNELLGEIDRIETTSVPLAGSLGTETVSSVPGVSTKPGSAASLTVAEKSLEAQRARWVASLYKDSQTAAANIGLENNWVLTFKPSTGANLTQQVARALAAGPWKQ